MNVLVLANEQWPVLKGRELLLVRAGPAVPVESRGCAHGPLRFTPRPVSLSSSVCGDGVCEEEELCSTCPADCGECPMTLTTKLAIGLPLSLLCFCLVLTALVRIQQKKC